MNKFLKTLCFWVCVAGSQTASAGHEAIESLFENGSLRLENQRSCEPYQLAAHPAKNSQTLAQDVAWVLADMSEKSLDIESACELDAEGKKLCKVIFSISEGELEWARVYQFESISGPKGRIGLKGLSCFNLP